MQRLKTKIKHLNNKRTLVNLYKDIVLSDPSTHLMFVYQHHIKIVIKIRSSRKA